MKAGNHEEAHRLFTEACDVDKHNKKYRLVSDQLLVSKFLGDQHISIIDSHNQAPTERGKARTPESDKDRLLLLA